MTVGKLKDHPVLKITQIGEEVDKVEERIKRINSDKAALKEDELRENVKQGREIVSKLSYRARYESEELTKKLLVLDGLEVGQENRQLRKTLVNRIMENVNKLDGVVAELKTLLDTLPEPVPEISDHVPEPTSPTQTQAQGESEEEEEEEAEEEEEEEEEQQEPKGDSMYHATPTHTAAAGARSQAQQQQQQQPHSYQQNPYAQQQQQYQQYQRQNPYRQHHAPPYYTTNYNRPPKQGREIVPDVRAVERPQSFQLYVELPGFEKQDVKIDVDGNVLDLKGVSGRDRTHFHRKVTIPDNVAVDYISANLEGGVLEVTLPKIPTRRHRRWF